MNFRPMLAGKAEPEKLKYPLFASPKLDGVRGVVIDGQLVSRTLKRFPNLHTQRMFDLPGLVGFDGELIVGPPMAPDVYRVTNSAVSRIEGAPQVLLYAFDLHDLTGKPFAHRLDVLMRRTEQLEHPCIKLVEQRRIKCEDDLLAYESECLELGYEGVMVRSYEGPYKYGRSTLGEGWLLKLKRYSDSEAEILEVVQGKSNQNEARQDARGLTERSTCKENMVLTDTVGAFVVRDVRGLFPGQTFKIGTGNLTQAECDRMWRERDQVVGKVCKYKFFGHGVKDKPRHGGFLGLRMPEDM